MKTLKAPRGKVKIGCCGFRSSREDYYSTLKAVEVQHTFYQPPRAETLAKWRAAAPRGWTDVTVDVRVEELSPVSVTLAFIVKEQ